MVDEIESAITLLQKVPLSSTLSERKQQQEIRTAFLYDCAKWLDNLTIIMPQTARKIDETTFKEFFLQVFLKSLIQGKNFQYYEAVDLDLFQITHFPDFLKDEAVSRKLLTVETQNYWFALAPAEKVEQNPFSLRRFLFEEKMGAGYVYLNGLGLPKSLATSPTVQRVYLNQIGRIFSLDKNISEELKKFALRLKHLTHGELADILQGDFSFDGSNAERAVAGRVVKFEEALTSKVLQLLPTMFAITGQSEFNQDFLLNALSRFFGELQGLIEKFKLHPLARHSFVASNLAIKLICFEVLIQKNRVWIFDGQSYQEKQEELGQAMQAFKNQYEESLAIQEELLALKSTLKTYEDKKANGGFLAKLGFGKPKYSKEILDEELRTLNEDFFISILKLTKEHKRAVVYLEYETEYSPNELYRHYAIANQKHGLSRLPTIINLIEDRERFSFESLKDEVYWEIFTQIDNI